MFVERFEEIVGDIRDLIGTVKEGADVLAKARERGIVLEELTLGDLLYAIRWLKNYGYFLVVRDDWSLLEKLTYAVRTLQQVYGDLEADGVLGTKTYRAMFRPRCGCPDFMAGENLLGPGGPSDLQRMASPWGRKRITYKFIDYVDDFPRSDQEELFHLAGKLWSGVCDVSLEPSDDPDIVVTSGRGRRYNLDGRGGTLAYTYLRQGWNFDRNGPIPLVFDIDEVFKPETDQMISYVAVACHELGHVAINLTHSRQRGALMYPSVQPGIYKPQKRDDIPRAVHQFGEPIDDHNGGDTPGDDPGPGPQPGGPVVPVGPADYVLGVNGGQLVMMPVGRS